MIKVKKMIKFFINSIMQTIRCFINVKLIWPELHRVVVVMHSLSMIIMDVSFSTFLTNFYSIKLKGCCIYLHRGSYMSAHVLLNLLNKLWKSDKRQDLPSILLLFGNKFNKFNKTGAWMLNSIYHVISKLIKNHIFGVKTSRFLTYFTQGYNGHHNVSRKSVTNSGSLPDPTSYDKCIYKQICLSLAWQGLTDHKGVLAIRRIFSLVDMITKPKFSNCPNIFKIGLFR